jgi:DNA-binding transcriptional MerR regulator
LGEEPGKLYYRIGEASQLTGVKPYVLRYWESEFRWMAPQKSRTQQRLYKKRDIDVILLIKKLLYEERFTIEGARRRLRELGVGGASIEGAKVRRAIGDPREELARLRSALASVRELLVVG